MATVRPLLETGPVALVPLAWGYTIAVHRGWATVDSLQIAHGVMIVLMGAFLIGGRELMRDGALAVWRVVIAVGIAVTAVGFAGFVTDESLLLAVSLYGWMLMPGAALLVTGRQQSLSTAIYAGSGLVSILGGLVYAAPVAGTEPVGLVLVGAGQTVGIAKAVTE